MVRGFKAVMSGDKKEGTDIGDADVEAEVRTNRLRRVDDSMMRKEEMFLVQVMSL